LTEKNPLQIKEWGNSGLANHRAAGKEYDLVLMTNRYTTKFCGASYPYSHTQEKGSDINGSLLAIPIFGWMGFDYNLLFLVTCAYIA